MIRITGIDIAGELDKDRRYLASRGVSAAFIVEAFQSGTDSMWMLEQDALRRAGVLRTLDRDGQMAINRERFTALTVPVEGSRV